MLRVVDSYTISVLGSAYSICMHQWVEVGMATELASEKNVLVNDATSKELVLGGPCKDGWDGIS